MHHLEDVPLEIMPEVLEFVQKYPEARTEAEELGFPDESDHMALQNWGYMSHLRPDVGRGLQGLWMHGVKGAGPKPSQVKRLVTKMPTGEPL